MTKFAYTCPRCGEIEHELAERSVMCRCGHRAKRLFRVAFNRSSTKPFGRWDPVVGEYVESRAQFDSLLHKSQDAQAEKLGMDVKLATCDARDQQALAELHGTTVEQRQADLEPQQRARHDRMVS